jgi:hypothetical protein
LLKNEILGANIEDKDQSDNRGAMVPLAGTNLFQVQQLYIRSYQMTAAATTTTIII